MTTPEHSRGSPARKGAVLLALRYYGRQMARLWRFTVPAMLLPALGNTCIYYVAPLIVAQLVGRFAGHTLTGIGAAMPYVLGFVGVLLFAEIVWRIGLYGVIRLEGHGIENLYVIGMDELLAKDAAFFHGNFAGSLTKRVLSFASRFEDFTDNLVFNIVGSLVPLAFASVVLWRYDPLLVAGLIGLIAITGAGIAPLIRRRQKLVDQREEAIARVSGHVADSLMNMDTIRAFAAEDREAAEHRSRVADQRRKTLRSWDYENLRIDTLVAPMSVLTNAIGLLLAISLGASQHGIEAIVVAFTYELMRPVLPANLLGTPAAVVPAGMADGLPVGVQVMGGKYTELRCLAVAEAIEQQLGPLTPIDPVARLTRRPCRITFGHPGRPRSKRLTSSSAIEKAEICSAPALLTGPGQRRP